MRIRLATLDDLPAICAIENREIETGHANFGLTPVSLEQRSRQFLDAIGRHPWFVAEDGAVRGFARASAWKARGAYAWTAEIGVYVVPDMHGRGIGKQLYAALFPAMEVAGLRTIVAGIALPNPASVKLHEAFGMNQVALLPKMGFKFGQWWDVGYWSKHLGDGEPSALQ